LLNVDSELLSIVAEIISMNLTLEDWNKQESSDQFQSEHYVGGYDSDEEAFCFSYYNKDNEEFWFDIAYKDLASLKDKKISVLPLRSPS